MVYSMDSKYLAQDTKALLGDPATAIAGDGTIAGAQKSLENTVNGLSGTPTLAYATDELQWSADALQSTMSDTYVEVKKVIIGVWGVIKVVVDYKSPPSGYAGYWKLKKNGVEVLLWNNNAGTWMTINKQEIIVQPGDELTVEMQISNATNPAECRNFRCYYSVAQPPNLVVLD